MTTRPAWWALQHCFLPRDFKVVTAGDGQVALAEFRRAQPDLVLSDVKMPVLSGIEVCRHIKSDAETRLAKKRSPIMNTKNGCPVHHSRVHQTPTEAKSLHPVIARPGLAAERHNQAITHHETTARSSCGSVLNHSDQLLTDECGDIG